MKLPILCLVSFALGLLAAAALLGRYQVVITSAGDGAGYVARVDRWTGEVSGRGLAPVIGADWSTWSTARNPYLD